MSTYLIMKNLATKIGTLTLHPTINELQPIFLAALTLEARFQSLRKGASKRILTPSLPLEVQRFSYFHPATK